MKDSERLLDGFMRTSSIWTIIVGIASSIVGTFGSWTGAFSLGPLTQVQLVMTYVGAGFVSLFCLLGSLRTELRAEYWAAVSVGAMMAGNILRHPDWRFGIIYLLIVVGGLTATFFAHDGGDFRKVIRDLRTPRNAH